MDKKQLMVLIAAVVMLVLYTSTIISNPISSSARTNVQLPKDNIINYRLDPNLRSSFINASITVLNFEYNSNCDTCYDQKSYLESMATQFKTQMYKDAFNVYLEEIVNDSIENSILTIDSVLGNKTLTNPEQNETFDSVCDLMANAPVICALKSS